MEEMKVLSSLRCHRCQSKSYLRPIGSAPTCSAQFFFFYGCGRCTTAYLCKGTKHMKGPSGAHKELEERYEGKGGVPTTPGVGGCHRGIWGGSAKRHDGNGNCCGDDRGARFGRAATQHYCSAIFVL